MANNTAQGLFNVNGLVAVITGGGSGLGLYAARALDANGAKAVYIIGRRREVLEHAAATAKNGAIKPLVGDVTDKESLRGLVAQIKAEQGFINFLFANAGISGPSHATALAEAAGDKPKPTPEEFSEALLATDPSEYTQVQHVNNTAVFYTSVAFLPLLHAGNQKRNVAQDSQILVTVGPYLSIP